MTSRNQQKQATLFQVNIHKRGLLPVKARVHVLMEKLRFYYAWRNFQSCLSREFGGFPSSAVPKLTGLIRCRDIPSASCKKIIDERQLKCFSKQLSKQIFDRGVSEMRRKNYSPLVQFVWRHRKLEKDTIIKSVRKVNKYCMNCAPHTIARGGQIISSAKLVENSFIPWQPQWEEVKTEFSALK